MSLYNTWIYYKTPNRLHKVTRQAVIKTLGMPQRH